MERWGEIKDEMLAAIDGCTGLMAANLHAENTTARLVSCFDQLMLQGVLPGGDAARQCRIILEWKGEIERRARDFLALREELERVVACYREEISAASAKLRSNIEGLEWMNSESACRNSHAPQ